MSHHIHHTKAFVLLVSDRKEADRSYLLLTEKFGSIYVNAQGIRYEKSKIRFSLQNYSFSEIALIKGRSGWRLTGAKLFGSIPFDRIKYLPVLGRVFKLVQKLSPQEESCLKIFSSVEELFNFLKGNNFDENKIESVEILTVLRILLDLGYLGNEILSVLPNGLNFDKESLESLINHKQRAVSMINKGIKESQLQ